jgi:hypothetical protein|tara:strand:- start:297 stop:464 length:168 start_codon:yes stop_codon:yes gene_type:complete
MRPVIFDAGLDIKVNSLHCDNCQFNVTEAKELKKLKKFKGKSVEEIFGYKKTKSS